MCLRNKGGVLLGWQVSCIVAGQMCTSYLKRNILTPNCFFEFPTFLNTTFSLYCPTILSKNENKRLS